jgi:hypothetical protein
MAIGRAIAVIFSLAAACATLFHFGVSRSGIRLGPSPSNAGASTCLQDPLQFENVTASQTAADAALSIEAECGSVTNASLAECPVPNILHLVLGFPGNFDFYSYLAVKAAFDRMHPDAIYLHVFGRDFEHSAYLERAKKEFNIKVVRARDVTQIFDRPVNVVEHKSDVVRLESLIRFGGIYMDLDTYVLEPLDVFYENELTMPAEYSVGISNALIIAKRCSRFLRNWYTQYKSFDDSQWGDHSIILPKKLAGQYPDLIRVEQYTLEADGWDTFNQLMSEKFEPEYWKPIRALHSFMRLAQTRYDEESVKTAKDNFGLMARRILDGKSGMIDPPPPTLLP